MSPTQKYRLLMQTDPHALTPDVVRKLREDAAAAGEAELSAFLQEMIGSGDRPHKSAKGLLFG